jgi:hypothetical protein
VSLARSSHVADDVDAGNVLGVEVQDLVAPGPQRLEHVGLDPRLDARARIGGGGAEVKNLPAWEIQAGKHIVYPFRLL